MPDVILSRSSSIAPTVSRHFRTTRHLSKSGAMVSVTMNILIFLLCAFGALASVDSDGAFVLQSYLMSDLTLDNHEACRLISKDGSGAATMHVYIDRVESTSNIDKLKIPILIMRASDTDNFTVDYVFEGERSPYEKLIDEKTTTFDLKTKKGAPKIDPSRLLNDYMVPDPRDGNTHEHVDIVFEVPESGIYCALIAVPDNSGLSKLRLVLNTVNSHGLLDFSSWVIYKQLLYGILVGVALVVYLIYYILRFKVGSNFQNLNSVSLISKGIIFRVLIPLQLLLIFRWFFFFVSNHYAPSEHKLLAFFDGLLLWADSCFNVYIHFCVLLFAMGYGVIYDIGKSSSSYNKIPYSSWRLAKALFIGNLAALTLNFVFRASGMVLYDKVNFSELALGPTNGGSFQIVTGLLVAVTGIYPIVWLIVSLSHYFKTQKLISNFPATGNDAGEREAASLKTSKCFKRSILVIFVLPIFVFTMTCIVLVVGILRKSSLNFSFAEDGRLQNSGEIVRLVEYAALDSRVYKAMVWTLLLEVYGSVALLYFIWIKNNNGLVTKETVVDEYEVDSE